MSGRRSGECRAGTGVKRSDSARGFSLVELLFVVLIATITTLMAIPVVRTAFISYKLSAAVNSVTGSIQTTRYQAISKGYPFQIVFTKATSKYQILSDPGNVGAFANVGVASPFTSTATLGQDTTFTFSPGGAVSSPQADATGTTTMTLQYSGNAKTITISPFGRANVTP